MLLTVASNLDNYLTLCFLVGVFGVMYDGYLSNAEDDVEGAIPVIVKTVKGKTLMSPPPR